MTVPNYRKMKIIPAIDLIKGNCVRLTEGDYATEKVYSDNPVDMAKHFEQLGCERLHMVDLDGAKAGSPKNLKVLEKVANQTDLVIDFGGGIKTNQNINDVFNAGAEMASIGSIAVKEPAVFSGWVEQYGGEKIVLGADVRDKKIAIGGWLETTETELFDFLKDKIANGVKQCFITDISKDGKLQGAAVDLYQEVKELFPTLYLIASGGVSKLSDLEDLKEVGCDAAIVGKAFYEGRISDKELRSFNEGS
jgi:phosphoribosylformimino-5-aminoimidazole carboxamide ribotide isomerase